jgi:hypothetical protein
MTIQRQSVNKKRKATRLESWRRLKLEHGTGTATEESGIATDTGRASGDDKKSKKKKKSRDPNKKQRKLRLCCGGCVGL